MLTQDQVKANIDALMQQGAPRETIQGYLDSLKGQNFTQTPVGEPKSSLLGKVGSVASSVFNPINNVGSSVGKFLGDATGVGGLIKSATGQAPPIFKPGGLISPEGKLQQPFNPQGVKEAVGTGVKLGLTAGTLGTGGIARTLSGRAIESGITGGAYQAANNLEKNKPIGENVGLTSAVSAAVPYAGEGLGMAWNGLTKVLPKSLIKAYFPATKDISEHVLENTKLGFTKTMLENARNNVKELSGKIQSYLETHHGADVGNGSQAIQDTLGAFPNSGYTTDKIVKTVKNLVPGEAKLVDKVVSGVATIPEKNVLRMALDKSVESVYTKLGGVNPAKKELGATFAGFLRDEVKSIAKATVPIFDELSKEINVRKALFLANKKFGKVNLRDILTFITAATGVGAHNPLMAIPAAGAAVLGERAVTNPAVGLGVAKGLSALGRVPIPQGTENIARFAIPRLFSTQSQGE